MKVIKKLIIFILCFMLVFSSVPAKEVKAISPVIPVVVDTVTILYALLESVFLGAGIGVGVDAIMNADTEKYVIQSINDYMNSGVIALPDEVSDSPDVFYPDDPLIDIRTPIGLVYNPDTGVIIRHPVSQPTTAPTTAPDDDPDSEPSSEPDDSPDEDEPGISAENVVTIADYVEWIGGLVQDDSIPPNGPEPQDGGEVLFAPSSDLMKFLSGFVKEFINGGIDNDSLSTALNYDTYFDGYTGVPPYNSSTGYYTYSFGGTLTYAGNTFVYSNCLANTRSPVSLYILGTGLLTSPTTTFVGTRYSSYYGNQTVNTISFYGNGDFSRVYTNAPIYSSQEAMLSGDTSKIINLERHLQVDSKSVIDSMPSIIAPIIDLPSNTYISTNTLKQIKEGINTIAATDPTISTETYIETVKEVVQQAVTDTAVKVDYVPAVNPGTNVEIPEPTDTGIDIITSSQTGSKNMRLVFPFCIPFDLIDLIGVLDAEPAAPRWEIPIKAPLYGIDYTFVLDMSDFEQLAVIFRTFETALFILGLILLSRGLIRG